MPGIDNGMESICFIVGGTGTQYNSSREQFHYIYQIIPILGIFSEDIMGKCTESCSLLHDL